jgi:hypothetical protein
MHCVAGDDVTAGPLRDNRAGSMTVWWKSRSFSNPPTVYEGAQQPLRTQQHNSSDTGGDWRPFRCRRPPNKHSPLAAP